MMRTILKWFVGLLAAIALGISAFFVWMRFHDGPLEIVSGGPFRTGELTTSPENWSFLSGRDTIQFQTMDPATSRTVWLVVHDDRLFLASAYMKTGYGALWKQWPHYLEADDRILIRVDGRIYEQRLERIVADPVVTPVIERFAKKYGGGVASSEAVTSGSVWLYEVEPRDAK